MGYQTYPEYRDPGVQWLGKVPAHWGDRRLKYVASCNDDVLNEDSDPDRLIRYVDIGNVSEGRIQGAEEFSFHNAPFRARRLVKDGDIIVSTVRTYLRAIAVIHNPPEEMVVSTGFAVIRPRNIDGNFLAQALKSNAFVDWVVAESKGISYPAINASELMGLSIALPPSEEQTTIAAFLDEKTTQIDQLIEKKTRFIELLKEKRAALITGAVTGKFDVRTGKPYPEYKDSGVEWLGKVPRHWRVQRIASLYRESNESGIHELPVLQISIHHGASDTELTNETSDRKITRIEDRSKYKRVRPNDLAYNMMRAWQGGFGAISVEGLVSPAYVVATPITTISSRFVELLLRTPQAIELMRRFSYGITDFRLRLYWDQFKIIRIALPPYEEAKTILTRIEIESRRIDALMEKTRQSIDLLKEKRAALITAAVTGKIDVRDYG